MPKSPIKQMTKDQRRQLANRLRFSWFSLKYNSNRYKDKREINSAGGRISEFRAFVTQMQMQSAMKERSKNEFHHAGGREQKAENA